MRPPDSSLPSSPLPRGPRAPGYALSARRRQPRSQDDDRRRNPRFPLANTEIGNRAVGGRVLDLSRAGMAIESHTALRPGQRYTFTLTIGEHVEELEARVLWCRLRSTERVPSGDVLPIYRAGIERVPPEPEPEP